MKKREFSIENEYKYDYRSHVKWLISHLMRDKYYLIGFFITCIIVAIANVYISKITGHLFDLVVDKSITIAYLGKSVIFVLLIYLAIMLFKSINYFFIEITASRIERNTRDELYLNLLGKSQTFHNRHRTGDIMASAGNDVQFLNGMTNPGISNIINGFVNILVPVFFIISINFRLLIVPIIYEIFLVVSLKKYSKKFFPIAEGATSTFSKLSADLTESLGGISIIQGSGQENREIEKFINNVEKNCDVSIKKGRCQASYIPPLFFSVALALSFLHSFILFKEGLISVGQIVYYLSLLTTINNYSTNFIDSFSRMQIGLSAARRIYNLIVTDEEIDENASGYSKEMDGDIKFENVSFSYNDNTVLENISFTVKKGQTVAIVGQTGSGKSTITKLINRTYDVDKGNIFIDGKNIKDWSLESLRSQIAVIEQEINLFSRSIADNICFGLGRKADLKDIERAAKVAYADEFINKLPDKYETILGEQGVTLSGGQRQRIALARTVIFDPRIVVLDDSTSAIDSTTEAEIQNAISNVLSGRTTILITHRISQIKKADKIIMLERGRIIDEGTHEELLQGCERYKMLFIDK